MANVSQYVGKSAEYLVLSELTANGYNASLIGVDEGIDIVAIKNSRLFTFQVKARKGDWAHFNVQKKSLQKIGDRSYFVFVLMGEKDNYIVVMPYEEVRKRIDALPVALWKDKIYPIPIRAKDGKIYFGNMKDDYNEITRFNRNWMLK